MQALQPLSCPAVIFRKLMFVKCKTDLSGEIFHNLKDKASLIGINQCNNCKIGKVLFADQS